MITIILAVTFLAALGLIAVLAHAIRIARQIATPRPALAAQAAATEPVA